MRGESARDSAGARRRARPGGGSNFAASHRDWLRGSLANVEEGAEGEEGRAVAVRRPVDDFAEARRPL